MCGGTSGAVSRFSPARVGSKSDFLGRDHVLCSAAKFSVNGEHSRLTRLTKINGTRAEFIDSHGDISHGTRPLLPTLRLLTRPFLPPQPPWGTLSRT